ncbi:zinc transporter ZupT [Caulifigura coniformis]|uniref:Zinc transporter ZupT n=2 Tax=Caulifigura coniformis TaxID=2527983 RepID=A0A517SKD4_9PLAN|nr:zinc transporter ZupT [Caulifigura coniformis]
MALCGVYGAIIASASLIGGWLPGRKTLSHKQFQTLISFVGGLMLGVATLHLFPHAVHEAGAGSIDRICMAMAVGILVMFFLLRAFHVHHHEADPAAPGNLEESHVHTAECDHSHHHSHGPGASPFGWVGLFIGLGLHTLLDGVALGIAMQAEGEHGALAPGLGTLLAVALHKPMDSLSITTLMIAGKWSGRARLIVNLVFALLAPLGAAVTLLGASELTQSSGVWLAYGLAFSAGIFLCIALADLLPEMQFHSHFRWRLTAALLAGMAVAWSIQFLEPSHLHAG